jgi:hypothetical protein
LLLVALGGLGWGAWFLATHPNWGEPTPPQAPAALAVHAPSLTVTGWEQRGGRGEKLWQVTAHDVRASADGRTQWFRQITDGILFQNGRKIASFSAGQGQGNEARNTLSIRGGAHLRLEGDGTAVDTEEVEWQGPQRQLWLPRPIRLTRSGLRLEGARAHLDQKLGRLTSEFVSGHTRQFGFQAHHAALLFKERRLELSPVALDLTGGHGHAARVTYLAEDNSFVAQEIQMSMLIGPSAARATAATGLTIALLAAAHGAPAVNKGAHRLQVTGHKLTDTGQVMEGDDAVIVDEDEATTFTAQHVRIEKDATGKSAEKIIATGSPRGWNERDEVTGDKMTVYPKEHRAVVEGHFRVVVKPKPGDEPSEDKSDLRGQVKDGIMTGDHLEYDYRNKNVAARGNLKIVSRGRTATGEEMFYTDKTEDVEFRGPVHARDEKGQTFDTATGLTLSLKKDGISHVPGKFTATLFVSDDEEPPSSAPADGKSEKSGAATENKPQKAAQAPAPPATPNPPAPDDKSH